MSFESLSIEFQQLQEKVQKFSKSESIPFSTYRKTCQEIDKKISSLPDSDEKFRLERECKALLETIPRGPHDFLFGLTLGFNPTHHYFALTLKQRFQYKTDYENFKLKMTVVQFLQSIVTITLWPPVKMDYAIHFFTLFVYSSIIVREHVLFMNGSKIRLWWFIHHYLSVAAGIVLLIWTDGAYYELFRPLLVYFLCYTAGVQALQYYYQMGRLYTLRALSRVGYMDVTTESAQVHINNRLAFLLPFIFIGQSFQFYISFYLFQLYGKYNEWPMIVLSMLFGVIAVGNLLTTLMTIAGKMAKKSKSKDE